MKPAPSASLAALVIAASIALGGGSLLSAPDDAKKGDHEMQSPRRVLVTGTSRGLGLEFTRQYLKRGDRVFALVRRLDESKELTALAGEYPERLTLVAGDVTDDASIEAAQKKVASATDALDLLVNNAGAMGGRSGGLENLDLAEVRSIYEVNAIGPVRVTKAFLPLLKKGRSAKVINITSRMGSIQDNKGGGFYGYRMSKAALNMATRSLSVDLRDTGIACVAVDPGWVRTDMGGPGAPLAPEESVGAMVKTIDGLTLDRSGAFLDRDGQPEPY